MISFSTMTASKQIPKPRYEPEAPQRPIVIMLVDPYADTLALAKHPPINDTTLFIANHGGFDALSYLHKIEYHVDAIVVNLSMPDIDGIRFTRLVRENEQLLGKAKPIDIYWLTDWPPSQIYSDSVDEFNVKMFIRNPYNVLDLIQQVRDTVIHDTDDGMHLTR